MGNFTYFTLSEKALKDKDQELTYGYDSFNFMGRHLYQYFGDEPPHGVSVLMIKGPEP
jgi:hypothetical protein